MNDFDNHIEYWINSAVEDYTTAELLIDNQKILNGLFFCHLTIEKALKAHFVKDNNDFAPKTHNLIYLSGKIALNFNREATIFLGVLMKYQIQGRYPDYNPDLPDNNITKEYLRSTKEILLWLKQKL